MPYWLLELFIGLVLVTIVRQRLEQFLNWVAPRRWKEAELPPSSDMGSYSALSVLGAIVSFLLLSAALHSYEFGEVGAVIGALLIGWGAWAVGHTRHWWILELDCPLRQTLNSLASQTGVSLGRVRLRAGNTKTPRVFSDGSIELSTAFFRETPPDEQRFMLAAALYQRQTFEPLSRRLTWLFAVAICPLAIYLLFGISKDTGQHIVPLKSMSTPVSLYFLFYLFYRPKYNRETLKFAVKVTKDLEAAERAVRRTDANNAEERLTNLRQWWEKEQAQAAAAQLTIRVTATTTTPTQQQTLDQRKS